ncbi:MAG TPA: 4-hydroxythreonine-4-phosphate dehydrogenase PdxA, partial [Ferruginibacter sp.]|nr:4-hydroxythreonine-4-phosphate dehydrogenase PdxA [Ferruginibacter sp.]
VAFDIAGKGIADETAFRASLFACLDILHQRKDFAERTANPLKKSSSSFVANAVDEKLSDES